MSGWRKGLFSCLSRNAWNVTTFFGIPPNRVVEPGRDLTILFGLIAPINAQLGIGPAGNPVQISLGRLIRCIQG
jgi:hypothetical protein